MKFAENYISYNFRHSFFPLKQVRSYSSEKNKKSKILPILRILQKF